MKTSLLVARVALWWVLSTGLSTSAALAADDPASLYEEALQQFQKKEPEIAATYLKSALQAAPRFLAAHVLLGRIYLEQRDGAQAEKELRIALRLGADRSQVVLLLAEAYEQQFKFRQLLKEIQADGLAPAMRARVLVKRGDAYKELGQNDLAVLAFEEAALYDSASSAPLLGQAAALMAMSRFDKAETLVTQALDLDPKDPDAWYAKGSIAHARGRLPEALEHYAHALELDPEDYTARVARAGVYMDMGNDDAAIGDLESLYDEEGYDPQVPYLLGVARARLGDIEGSQKAMRRANAIVTTLPPEVILEHGETLLLSSLVEYSLGEWEKALEHLREYVRRYPDNPGPRRLLGSILFDKGDYDRAISVLRPALERAPHDIQLLTLLGKVYLKKGSNLEALELLDRAVTAGGAGEVEARTQLGLAQLRLGREDAGIERLSEVFSHNGDAREAGIALVVQHLRRGEDRAAAEVARLLSQRNPDDLELLNLLAGAEVAAGDLAAARSHYEQILGRDPTILVPAINLARIDQAEGKMAEALARLNGLSRQHAGSDLLMVERARLEAAMGNHDKAIDLVEKAVAINESALSHQLYLGELYLRSGAYGKIDLLGQKLERLFPRNLRVTRLLGRAYLAQGKVQKARFEFQNMSKLADDNAMDFVDAASLSRAAGDLDWAAWSLQNAIKLRPGWLAPRVSLAEVYLRAGKMELAGDVLGHLQENFPEAPATYRLIGDAAQARGHSAQAIQAYRKALDMGGGQEVVLRLFQAYAGAGDLAAAVTFLEDRLTGDKAITDKPLLARALAEGYLRLARIPAARDIYRQLVAAGLKDATVFNNLAMIYARDGDPQAPEMARRAHELAPDDPVVSDTLGWLLVEAGKGAEGLRHLRNAHLRAPSERGIRYHIAMALVRLDRAREAREELRAILSDDRAFSDRVAAVALLKQLGDPD